jgi:hypothetical protein
VETHSSDADDVEDVTELRAERLDELLDDDREALE